MSVLLSCNALAKSYASGTASVSALKDATFELHSGEMVVILGPSGSGKSTLLQILGLLLSPDSGRYTFLNNDITKGKTQRELERLRLSSIGFVFQDFKLIRGLTAAENVLVPSCGKNPLRSQALNAKTQELMTQLGVSKCMNQKSEYLSRGEMQRVALVRALSQSPKLILADEPTANLDSNSGREVVHLLHDALRTEAGAVIVTHDERILPYASRVFTLEDGVLQVG